MPDHRDELTLVGQKVVELAHDLANHLNSIVLQASCLLLKAEGKTKEELNQIRQEGLQAAALIAPLQQIGLEMRQHEPKA
jgi:hypothetical protein